MVGANDRMSRRSAYGLIALICAGLWAGIIWLVRKVSGK